MSARGLWGLDARMLNRHGYIRGWRYQYSSTLLTGKKQLVIVAFVISGLVTSVFAVGLFTHNFPGINSQSVLTTACGTGTSKLVASNPGPIPIGSSGTILFNCPPPIGSTTNAPSLTAAAPGTVTPSISAPLPTGMTLALTGDIPGSTTCSGGSPITSGTPMIFGGTGLATGSYDYCLSYSAFPSSGIPGFSITWNQ